MLTILYSVCYLFLFIVGVCIGSFLNVLVYRIPNRISFVKGRSFCPVCRHQLGVMDLAPLLSWLFLKGKCRYCGAKISPRYPLVELAGGCLALLSCWRLGFTVNALLSFLAGCLLLTIALIDGDTQEIPDGLNLALALVGVAALLLVPQIPWQQRLIGALCVSLPMLGLNLLVPTSFGGGDVKLMGAAGLFLGWKMTLVAMFFAVLSGGSYGAYLLARGKKGKKDHFAFGPFLAAGCGAAMFFGTVLLEWYVGTFWG